MFLTGGELFQGVARRVWYVFIAVFPFLIYKGFLFNGTSTRAMNLILIIEILMICLGFLLFHEKVKLRIPKSPISASLIILFLVLALASVVGVDFATSFWSKVTRTSGLYYFIHLGMFYFLTIALFHEKEKFRTLIKTFSISAAVFSLASLLAKDGLKIMFAAREWQGFTIGNSTFAGMYLFAGFIIALYYAVTTPKAERRWWHYALPVATIANPYLLGLFREGIIGGAQSSSYAMFASIIMLLGAWAISKISSLKIRRGVIWGTAPLGLVVGIFAVYSFLTPGGLIQKEYLKDATAARPFVWSLAKEAIAERPLLGYGVDNFDRAYQAHFDNRVMERTNGAEAWFDRAHNVFIDQAIESGYVGVATYLLVFFTIIGSMLYVIFRSKEKGDQTLAVFVIVYMIGHLMELQTAFDTTISYVPLVLVAAGAAILFDRTRGREPFVVPAWAQYVKGVALIGVFGALFFVGTLPILRSQIANGAVRVVGSSERRLPLYDTLFSSPIDTAGLVNRTTTDLKRGISLSPQLLEQPERLAGFKQETDRFIKEYETYLADHPEDFRARLDLAEAYVYETLFGADNLAKAHEEADKLIALQPNIPQAYWVHAIAYLYQRKFPEARTWAKKGLDLNPAIEESKHVVEYIDRSIKTFPEIGLFNFIML